MFAKCFSKKSKQNEEDSDTIVQNVADAKPQQFSFSFSESQKRDQSMSDQVIKKINDQHDEALDYQLALIIIKLQSNDFTKKDMEDQKNKTIFKFIDDHVKQSEYSSATSILMGLVLQQLNDPDLIQQCTIIQSQIYFLIFYLDLKEIGFKEVYNNTLKDIEFELFKESITNGSFQKCNFSSFTKMNMLKRIERGVKKGPLKIYTNGSILKQMITNANNDLFKQYCVSLTKNIYILLFFLQQFFEFEQYYDMLRKAGESEAQLNELSQNESLSNIRQIFEKTVSKAIIAMEPSILRTLEANKEHDFNNDISRAGTLSSLENNSIKNSAENGGTAYQLSEKQLEELQQ